MIRNSIEKHVIKFKGSLKHGFKIRLSRGGAKKRPFYRVVVADSRKPRDGRFIERVGSYNPMVPKDHSERFKIDEDRVKHWLSVGALPTNRVAQYLSGLGLAEKPTIPVQTKKDKPRAKTLERLKEQEEKAAAAAGSYRPKRQRLGKHRPKGSVWGSTGRRASGEAPAEEAASGKHGRRGSVWGSTGRRGSVWESTGRRGSVWGSTGRRGSVWGSTGRRGLE